VFQSNEGGTYTYTHKWPSWSGQEVQLLSLICKNGSVLEIQSFGPYIYYHHSRTQIHYQFRGTLIITLTYLRFSIVNKPTW